MSTQYYFPPYNASLPWKKFDVILEGSTYLYATQDTTVGGPNSAPTLQVSYTVSGYKREDDVTTLYFTQTGNVCNFQRGSIVKAAGLTNATCNFTGMALDGGSGVVSYINPGWSQGLTTSVGTVGGPNPAFTSGFFFSPTYTTKIGTENQTITTQLGDGYVQRAPRQVNSFNQTISCAFQNRSDREARAITNFVQDTAGSRSFEIMMPNSILYNQPNHKWVAGAVDVTPVAYNLNDISLNLARVFEP